MTKVNALLTDLQKQFGENAIRKASDIPIYPPISTGSLALDYATGCGGFPSDRVIELAGKEGTGKTTLALTAMVNALNSYPGRHGLFIDMEHKLDKAWMTRLVGQKFMDERIIYVQAPHIEGATNIYRKAVGSGQVCAAILDSIGGSSTIRRNEDAEVGHYGGNAIGVGEFARASAQLSAIHRCMTIGINQTRADMSGYNQLNLPGGRAWGYHVIMRVELVRGKDVAEISLPGEVKKVPIGYTIYAKLRKNQAGAPGRVAYYWFYNVDTPEHGFGIDQLDEISRLGIMTRVIEQKGGWYYHESFPGGKAQGLLKMQDAIRNDDSLKSTLVSEVMVRLGDHANEVAPVTDPDADIDTNVIKPTPVSELWAKGGTA